MADTKFTKEEIKGFIESINNDPKLTAQQKRDAIKNASIRYKVPIAEIASALNITEAQVRRMLLAPEEIKAAYDATIANPNLSSEGKAQYLLGAMAEFGVSSADLASALGLPYYSKIEPNLITNKQINNYIDSVLNNGAYPQVTKNNMIRDAATTFGVSPERITQATGGGYKLPPAVGGPGGVGPPGVDFVGASGLNPFYAPYVTDYLSRMSAYLGRYDDGKLERPQFGVNYGQDTAKTLSDIQEEMKKRLGLTTGAPSTSVYKPYQYTFAGTGKANGGLASLMPETFDVGGQVGGSYQWVSNPSTGEIESVFTPAATTITPAATGATGAPTTSFLNTMNTGATGNTTATGATGNTALTTTPAATGATKATGNTTTPAASPINLYGKSSSNFQGNGNYFTTGTTADLSSLIRPTSGPITVDQNFGEVKLPGKSTDYTFKQAGIQTQVFDKSGNQVSTIATQNDADGTKLVFSDGATNAKLNSGVLNIGNSTADKFAGLLNIGGGNNTVVGGTKPDTTYTEPKYDAATGAVSQFTKPTDVYNTSTFSTQYTAPTTYSAGTTSSGYTAPDAYTASNIASGYTAPDAYTASNITSGYTAPDAYTASNIASGFTKPANYTAANIATDLFDAAQRDTYMSPFMSGVVDPQLREAKRQSGLAGLTEAAKFAQSGAFGGSRNFLMESERGRNLARQLEDIYGKGQQSAFENAQQQFERDQQRKLEAAKANELSKQFGANLGYLTEKTAAELGLEAAKANELSRQFGYGQKARSAEIAATLGLEAAKANELSKQFGYGQKARSAEIAATLGLEAAKANELSKQFGYGQKARSAEIAATLGLEAAKITELAKQEAGRQGLTSAADAARYGLEAQKLGENSKQFAANYGLDVARTGADYLQKAAELKQRAQEATDKGDYQAALLAQQGLNELNRAAEATRTFNYNQQRDLTLDPLREIAAASDLLRSLPIAAGGDSSSSAILNAILASLGTNNILFPDTTKKTGT